jgi:hypothetical protein
LTITWDAESYDSDGMHSTSTNTSRITFNKAGTYRIAGKVSFAQNATGRRIVRLIKNGDTVNPIGQWESPKPGDAASAAPSIVFDDELVFAVNDYVELQAFQSSTVTLAIATGTPVDGTLTSMVARLVSS